MDNIQPDFYLSGDGYWVRAEDYPDRPDKHRFKEMAFSEKTLDAFRAKIISDYLKTQVHCSHRCVRCYHDYSPIGENEDCPRCGCDDKTAKKIISEREELK